MLLELAIKNFAIIRDLRIPFGTGFTALTGETGAGKSIIIDALGAVLGARVSSELVRSGADSAWVEALFDVGALLPRADVQEFLTETGIEPDGDTLILSRDINANGRSTARINGRTVTASTLNTLGALLVDIHGQSEHLSLLRPALHLEMLDHYADTLDQRAELAGLVREYDAIQRRIDDLASNERDRAQRVDLLRFQVEEIRSAALRPSEDDDLEQERNVLSNVEKLSLLANEAYNLLEGSGDLTADPIPGALDNLRQAVARVEDLARLDPAREGLAAQLRDVQFLLEDATADIRGYADQVEADPARLADIEDRLAIIRQLKRKYGATIEEISRYGEESSAELAELDSSEQRIEELTLAADRLLDQIGQLAVILSARRREAAETLENAVEAAIAELNMGRARFVVDFGHYVSGHRVMVQQNGSTAERAFDATGIDRVEFLIAPNAGETPRPLARIASGGETARLMLALKSILSSVDDTPTLIFDEVDVGVGGRSGQPVGEKLWSLGERHQVIVISHLPQIAAFAEAHYRITKFEHEGRTETRIEPLDEAERIDELAAMLDGQPVTTESQENARAMLERISAWKRRAVSASRPG